MVTFNIQDNSGETLPFRAPTIGEQCTERSPVTLAAIVLTLALCRIQCCLPCFGSVEVVLYQAREIFTWGTAIGEHCASLDAERSMVQSLLHMCIIY